MDIILFVIGVACFVASFLIFRTQKPSPLSLLLKFLSSVLIIVCGLLLAFRGGKLSHYSMPMLVGMLFGTIGDVVLDLKVMYKKDVEDSNMYMYMGFVAFAICHVAYSFGMESLFALSDVAWFCALPLWSWYLILIAPTLVMTVGTLMMLKMQHIDLGKHKPIVTGYCFVLSYMVMSGILLCILDFSTYWMLGVGFIAFALSDVVLSYQYFGDKGDNKFFTVINHVLYYIGQILIVIVGIGLIK